MIANAPMPDDQLHRWKKSRRNTLRLFLRVLGTKDADILLTHLEQKFEVNLPVFQGDKGHYDPLDAMRRDAYREVFLHLRHQIRLAREENQRNAADAE